MKSAASAAIIAAAVPLASAFAPPNTHPSARSPSSSLALSYLDNLSGGQPNSVLPPAFNPFQQQAAAPSAPAPAAGGESTGFCHVPLDYFAFDNLSSKVSVWIMIMIGTSTSTPIYQSIINNAMNVLHSRAHVEHVTGAHLKIGLAN